MSIENIEKSFVLYLDRYWKLSDINPFLLAYIKLLLLFKNELPPDNLKILLERKNQLCGGQCSREGFDELRISSRKKIDQDLKNSKDTREGMLSRLIFCALLDTEESDFFYLTEPMFEFAHKMQVPPEQLKEILESEFQKKGGGYFFNSGLSY